VIGRSYLIYIQRLTENTADQIVPNRTLAVLGP